MLRGSGRYAPATPPLLATRPGKSRGLWKVRVATESCYYATAFPWSACCRRQAASRHERLAAFTSRSKTVSAEDRAALPSLWRRRIRKRSEMITARHSRQLQAVEPGHVLPHDHPRFLLR